MYSQFMMHGQKNIKLNSTLSETCYQPLCHRVVHNFWHDQAFCLNRTLSQISSVTLSKQLCIIWHMIAALAKQMYHLI